MKNNSFKESLLHFLSSNSFTISMELNPSLSLDLNSTVHKLIIKNETKECFCVGNLILYEKTFKHENNLRFHVKINSQ